ncbi:hypothetical protein J3E64_002527 [Sphingobium sp. OAS761]|uniref:3-keto-disaccharide hydrolase n=1 Tax=Sphingobium sp. OAS761 TaxID=2817901 RepID=UPI00209E73E0|nr:DUF1080 domain-containing protein [Sphingobium sp. OAS761]MCP1470834.1 hypothetical protein [Sphingobium sp. OAS761]
MRTVAWGVCGAVLGAALAIGAGAAEPPAAKGTAQPFVLKQPRPRAFQDHEGFVSLFDGRTLAGWDGDPDVWRVENGAIVAVRPPDRAMNNSYLVYRRLKARDFDLRLEIKAPVGGSGIQYRSRTGLPWINPVPGAPPPKLRWMMTGPQADFWPAKTFGRDLFSGQVYMENDLARVTSWRGQVTRRSAAAGPELVGTIAESSKLALEIRPDDWNEYEIIARGPVVLHFLNGRLMSASVFDDPESPDNRAGWIGIEAELNPARVEVRNIWLRKLD